MGPMAARTMSLATNENDFMKETLHAQQELLQKLYNELDEERESSATAADEALSMILRLQGEKSAIGMEASQYKRIAEEKMCHAEETLEVFKELIYQKEMQIASLEFQVQAYKFKLLSMGCDDLGVSELQYPENILSRKNGALGESSSRNPFRRGSSLPPPPVNGAFSRRSSTEGTKSSASTPKIWQEPKGAETSVQNELSYWEEIMKLDERVKEWDSFKGCNSSPTSRDTKDALPTSTFPVQVPFTENSTAESECFDPDKGVSIAACEDSACSTSVQDIFEVPVCSYNNQGSSSSKTVKHNLSLECVNGNEKVVSVWDDNDIWNSDIKEKFDLEKKPLLSPNSDKRLSKESDATENIDWEKKPLLSPEDSNGSHNAKDGKIDKPLLYKHPTYGVADFEFQQFNRRLKQLEDQRFAIRAHEPNAEIADELRVLWEIKDKIDSLQAEIASWNIKKPSPPVDRSLGCFKEAFLCFLP